MPIAGEGVRGHRESKADLPFPQGCQGPAADFSPLDQNAEMRRVNPRGGGAPDDVLS